MTERTPSMEMPPLDDVAAESARLGLATPASELHGAICGWLAGGGEAGPGWLGRVMADATPTPPADGPLDRLLAASASQLEDRDFGFELLLPDADASLAERSGALFDWCRGFLGAFGMAAGGDAKLSDEGSEALSDLAKLAMATPQDDGDQEDEAALAEIEEFVRVATLLLHGDCVLAGRHRRSMH
jgi:uncharacterized protein YgfB (UPF0149 family)